MTDQENQEILRNLRQALQPMILKLRYRKTRASALSSLANHLHQLITNEEAEMFNTTCIFLFDSDQTMGILEETILAFTGTAPPEILLHIFRCYDLLRTIPNGLAALKGWSLSLNLMQAAAHTMLQDHPEISKKIGQVLRSLSVED